jgi:hypothetical protein
MAKFGKDIDPEVGAETQFSSTNQPTNSGRKPKSFKQFNTLMKERGIEPLSKEDLIEAYSLLLSMDEENIQEIADDDKQPLALRLIISEMTDERTRSSALRDFRDYMFGKALQQIQQDITVKEEQPLFGDD